MQKNMLIAVGSGGLSAIASLAFLNGIPGALLFVYLATLPLFLVAFSLGTTSVSVASISGIATAGLLGGLITAIAYTLFNVVPAWFVSKQSLKSQQLEDGSYNWYSIGNVLCSLAILCAALMVIGALEFTSGSELSLQLTIEQALHEVFNIMFPAMSQLDMLNAINRLSSIFPGAMGSSWVVMTIVNAVLAQTIVVRMKCNIRPTPKFTLMELPQWAALPLIITAAAALVLGGEARYMAQNVSIILATPFFFLGLSVIHWAVRRVQFAAIVLTVFYIIMISSGWALILVAGLGMIEQWAGVRSRFNTDTDKNLPKSENSDANDNDGQ